MGKLRDKFAEAAKNRSKYYIPTIEEFHVGFEYEMNPTEDGENIAFVVGEGDLSYVEIWLREKLVRIKYLDQEDIESLGFEFEEEDSDFITFRKHNDDQYYWEIHVVKDKIWKDIYICEVNLYKTGWEEPKFEGDIKNKSELKIVLKQIGAL